MLKGTHTHKHTHTQTHTHTHTRARAHAHAHTHIYIYIFIIINLAFTPIFLGEGWEVKSALCKCGDLLIHLYLVPDSITCGCLPPLHIGVHGVLVLEETLARIAQSVQYLGCELHDRCTNIDSQKRLENSSLLVYQDQSCEPPCNLSSIEGLSSS